MKKIVLLFLVIFLVSLSIQAQIWTKLSLPETGKEIEDLYEDLNGNLYALTAQGLFKSSDKAENWTLLDRNMEGYKILLGANNGDVWVNAAGALGPIKYNGSSSDETDVNVTGYPSAMVTLSDGKIISISGTEYRTSTDNGTSYSKSTTVTNIFSKRGVKAELMVNKNDDVFYLGTDKNLYKSTDKGETFTAMGAPITYTNRENTLSLDREKDAFYALWGSNNAKDLMKSTDDGASWIKLNSNKLYGADRIVAYNDIVIIHGSFTFLYSIDGGVTFTDKKAMFETRNFPEKVFITKDTKILATNIKGNAIVELDLINDTKTVKTKGLDFTNPKGLSYNGTRLAGCLNGYAHYTDDNGATWQELKGSGANAGNTYVTKNGKVYTSSNAVYVQDDTDTMVAVIADVKSVWNIRSMFEDDQGNIYCLSNLNGLYKSADGMNFTQMATAPYDNLNDMTMWFDEGLKRIYAIVTGEAHYSDDYAVTWTKGTPLASAQNNFFKGNGGMWTYTNNGTATTSGFYFSTDLTTWNGPNAPNISFDNRWDEPVQGNLGVLYRAHKDNAYQGGTVLESKDNGITWNPYADGLDTVKGYGFNGGGKGVPYNEILAANNKLFLATVGSIYIVDQEKSLSVENNNVEIEIEIYPNPVSNILNLKVANKQIQSIKIFNIIGKEVMRLSANNNSLEKMNVSQLSKGMYLLQIKTATNFYTERIIKK